MTRRAAAALRLATAFTLGALALGAPAAARAQGDPRVEVIGPTEDTLKAATPVFVLRASALVGVPGPVQLTLQIARQPQFLTGIIVDTTVTGTEATIALPRPLPEKVPIFWRARLRTGDGREVFSATSGPHVTATWLALVRPNDPAGRSLQARRPLFVWRAAWVATPPGPWRFRITIRNASTQAPIIDQLVLDTAFAPPFDLESNTSYRWSVLARLSTGDSTRVSSAGSFVIVDEKVPLATLLYQNFPNPFPTLTSPVTCIWFDLRVEGAVRLEVYDLRGFLVRRIAPARGGASILPAGRYGRFGPDNTSGCDPQYQWDGRDDGGREVPAGVYLLRFRGDRTESFKKIVFRGR